MSTWTALRDLYERALALPQPARLAFVAAECSDPALRARLERMLDVGAGDDLPLGQGAVEAAGELGEPELQAALPAGTRIGAFELQIAPDDVIFANGFDFADGAAR